MHENIVMESENEANSNLDMVSYDKIASKLLKEGFLLTALEFHAELIESGKELPRLRDFFSNPGNFEKHAEESVDSTFSTNDNNLISVLPRTSSVQTFDSLDFTRNSDDGERQVDERIAVLEFELRKAQETIKSLRASLTISTTADSASSNIVSYPLIGESSPNTNDDMTAKPHERRALNFLINEYLMQHNYKLTSITFCDENEDQDFESWDDVGLNVSKPPHLISLYRLLWWSHSRIAPQFTTEESLEAPHETQD